MPPPDIFARRKKILTGQRPALEYQSQEALEMGHGRELHNEFDLDLRDLKTTDTEFLGFEDFKRSVLYGMIEPPLEWLEKFPGFFNRAKLVIDTDGPPTNAPRAEEIYWVQTPRGKIAADQHDDYTVWYKPAGSDTFENYGKGKRPASLWEDNNTLWYHVHFFLGHSEKKPTGEYISWQQKILSQLKIPGDRKSAHLEYHMPPICRDGCSGKNVTADVTDALEQTWNNWLGRFKNSVGSNYDSHDSVFGSSKFSWSYQDKITETLENPLVRKLSLSAINQLFAHFDQTQHGLDHKHLMNGLVLQSNQLNYLPNTDTLVHKSQRYVEATARWATETDDKLPPITFVGNQKAWWDYLYGIHCHYHKYYHAAELLRIYHNFLRYIDEQKLTLPDAKFTEHCNIRSLPLALGRMITLLENCSTEDRQDQLNQIVSLDLGSHGAVRAAIEPKLPHYQHCRFVHRDMRCEAGHFTHDAYVTSEKYNIKMNIHTFKLIFMAYAECSEEKEIEKIANMKEAFWRYVAHNEGGSLAFYEKAIDSIETIAEKISTAITQAEIKNVETLKDTIKGGVPPPTEAPFVKANLYSLLAGLTTGKNFKDCPDKKALLEQWQRVCELMIRITTKYQYPQLLAKLRSLPVLPPLDLLEKILARYDKASMRQIQRIEIEHIDHGIDQLDSLLGHLQQAKIDATIVYQGVRHFAYDKKTHAFSREFTDPTKKLFKNWLDYFQDLAAPDNDKKTLMSVSDHNVISFVIGLAQFFSLTPEQTKLACNIIKAKKKELSPIHYRFQKNCFGLLQHFKKETKKLNITDLNCILGKITQLRENDAITGPATLYTQLIAFIDFLREKYSNSFPDDFLTHKRTAIVEKSKSITPAAALLISQKIDLPLQKMVKAILHCHADEYASAPVVEQFIDSVAELTGLYELHGNHFIDCLLRLETYENANVGKRQHTLKDLNALFKMILDRPNLAPFEAILYRPDIEKIPGLIQKISAVYDIVCPWLERNHPHISEQLTFAPMVDVVLAVPQEELEFFLQNSAILLTNDTEQKKEKVTLGLEREENYQYVILNYYDRIRALIVNKPTIKNDLLNYVSCFAKAPAEAKDGHTYAQRLVQQIVSLETAGKWLDDDQFRKLLHHSDHRPHALIAYLQAIEQTGVDAVKTKLAVLLTNLINETTIDSAGNEKPIITLETFNQFCVFIKNHYKKPQGKALAEQILDYYNWPPYRELAPLVTALNDFKEDNFSVIQYGLLNQDEIFNRVGIPRSPENQFNVDAAKKQAKKFSKHTHLTGPMIDELEKQLTYYRSRSTQEKNADLRALQQRFTEQKHATATDIANLTALLVELVFSTTHQEFNYTQVLALYSQLVATGNVTHQIPTGSGKSRIAMALAAGKTILGMKADFATENMKLAERDYYQYKAFFRACDIETMLIDADTSVEQYLEVDNNPTKSIVGFSCKSQIGLFHNKIKTKVDVDLFTNRVIIIDEADTFYCDNETLKLNLAVHDDKDTGDARWAYSFIYEFIQRPEFAGEYLDEKNTDTAKNSAYVFQQLRDYIQQKTSSFDKQQQFTTIADETLEMWLRAAIMAHKLIDGVDFDPDTAQDITMLTDKGLRVASKALVKIDNLVSTHSIYADAVQQFLHVRLNIERREKQKKNTKTCKTPYYIERINEVVYSSSASTLLNDYQQKLGLTGTSGSPNDRYEMANRYGMEFIDVPDHQPNKRIDLMVHLVKDQKQKTAVLKQYHQQTVAQNRGHLIFCKNDNEGRALADELTKDNTGTVQRIDGTLAGHDQALAMACQPQTTTVATNVWSRGVDVRSTDNNEGLAVTIGYLPKTKRDKFQLLGRTARYKMPGTGRLVLSIDDLKSDIERGKLNFNDLYFNRDDLIKRLQIKTEQNEQLLRSFNVLVDHCFDRIHKDFFERCHQAHIGLQIIQSEWAVFCKGLNEDLRMPASDQINSALEEHKWNNESIVRTLEELYSASSKNYNDFLHKKIKPRLKKHDDETIEYKSPTLDKAKTLAQMTPLEIDFPCWTKTYGQYDPSHAGQNVVYHKTFAETRWLWSQHRQGKISIFQFAIKLVTSQHKTAANEGHGLAHPEWAAFWANKRGAWANTFCTFFRGDLNAEWQALENAYTELNLLAKQIAGDQKSDAESTLRTIKTNVDRHCTRAQLQLFTKQLIDKHAALSPTTLSLEQR